LEFPNRSPGPPCLLLPRARAVLLCFSCRRRRAPPGRRSTSCFSFFHVSSASQSRLCSLPCCPPPRAPRRPEPSAGRHAPHRRRQLLLARVAPLLALRHSQLLLCDLLYSPEHPRLQHFLFPELDPSPDLRRPHCPLSPAAFAPSEPQSSAARAPP
jgi:hypothetical protein